MPIVVDASIAVKWFILEVHSEDAARLLRSKQDFLAPDLIWAEVGNVLWKKVLRKEISFEQARGILKDFLRFPVQTFGSHALLDAAWGLAAQYGITVYDSLYLAVAISQNCSAVTADRKFYGSLHTKPVGQKFLWVEDI